MSAEPTAYFFWVAFPVCAGQNSNIQALDAIPDQIGETVQYHAPDVAIKYRIEERGFRKHVHRQDEFREELRGQPSLLFLVPDLGLSNVTLSSVTYTNRVAAQGSNRRSRA